MEDDLRGGVEAWLGKIHMRDMRIDLAKGMARGGMVKRVMVGGRCGHNGEW